MITQQLYAANEALYIYFAKYYAKTFTHYRVFTSCILYLL